MDGYRINWNLLSVIAAISLLAFFAGFSLGAYFNDAQYISDVLFVSACFVPLILSCVITRVAKKDFDDER